MTASKTLIGRTSALLYTEISLGVALAFHAVARWIGESPPLAVWGGTVWLFILSMIISMPLATGWARRRSSRIGDEGGVP